jgi:hypothetical protein
MIGLSVWRPVQKVQYNSPWSNPSILRHSGILRAADEAVLNKGISLTIKYKIQKNSQQTLVEVSEQSCRNNSFWILNSMFDWDIFKNYICKSYRVDRLQKLLWFIVPFDWIKYLFLNLMSAYTIIGRGGGGGLNIILNSKYLVRLVNSRF